MIPSETIPGDAPPGRLYVAFFTHSTCAFYLLSVCFCSLDAKRRG